MTNNEVTKLLKKLYALPKAKFKVENYYKIPTLFHKFDYVHLEYDGSGYGTFAKINFLVDRFVKCIYITWSQVNNCFAFIEYNIEFKTIMDSDKIIEFTKEMIQKLTKKDYMIYYDIHDNKELYNLGCLKQMYNEYFQISCQHLITSLLYSEQGTYNKLLNLIYYCREKEIDIDKLYLSDFSSTYYNKREKYAIISSNTYPTDYEMYCGGKYVPPFNICHYVSHYGNDFYYNFFGYSELKIFENEFSKYTSGRKKVTYNKNLISLLNRFQSLSDGKRSRKKELEKT